MRLLYPFECEKKGIRNDFMYFEHEYDERFWIKPHFYDSSSKYDHGNLKGRYSEGDAEFQTRYLLKRPYSADDMRTGNCRKIKVSLTDTSVYVD